MLDEINRLKAENKCYSFREICEIISNLIDGIVELRLYEILHLDIKPGNILKNK